MLVISLFLPPVAPYMQIPSKQQLERLGGRRFRRPGVASVYVSADMSLLYMAAAYPTPKVDSHGICLSCVVRRSGFPEQ